LEGPTRSVTGCGPVAAAARHMSTDTNQNARDPRRDEPPPGHRAGLQCCHRARADKNRVRSPH